MDYDAESNILSWEIAQGKIDHVKEFGNFLIHLSAGNKPILIEILDASKFKGDFNKQKSLEKFRKVISIN
ncbi:DUF2283 domain-containing protein [bacterium]|nr:DUF2283 domain-containing protein [bacterium]